MELRLAAAVITASLALGGAALASPITYNVNQTIGSGSVTGTIETDGSTGTLDRASFLGWNLNLVGPGASLNLTDGNSTLQVAGNDITASANALSFNFGGSDNGFALFQDASAPNSGTHFFCDSTAGLSTTPCFQGGNDVPGAYTDPSAQYSDPAGNQVFATAATPVPEPLTLSIFGMGLAGAAVMRRRKKNS